jgi:hypothetical protein
MRYLKQSTSVDLPIGPFLDATDGITAESGLTITQPDVRLKKGAAAWAQKAAAQTLTHEENGYYEVTLDATDTNTLGPLRLAVHESGALPVWEDFEVMPANVWDSLFGADALQVHANEITADLITATSIAANAITSAKVADGFITAAKLASDAITAAKIADGAIDRATFAADTGMQTIRSNTAQAGAAGSITLDASASAVDDFYLYTMIEIVGGTGIGQARIVGDYVGATKVATVVPNWATTPDNTSVFAVVWSAVLPTTAPDSAAVIADAVHDEILSGHVIAGSLGQRLQVSRSNTAQAGAAGSITLDASASAVNDFYKDSLIFISAGTGVGQTRTVSTYTGATKVANVTPNWVTTPDNTSEFAIIPNGAISGATAPTAADNAAAVWNADATAHQTQGTFGQTIGDSGANVATLYSKTSSIPALDAAERTAIADAILTRADGIETGYTLQQAIRIMAAVLAGESSGGGTATVTFRNLGDTANRITATVTTDGNRTATVLTP